MTSSRNMVLIHGAWQGSWAFAAWTPLLQARGWKVLAVNLPGNDAAAEDDSCANLDGYTAHVLRVLESLDGPAVVVGHSGGGMTASQVAQAAPERVSALVYLAGMMLPSGMSYGDVIAQCRAADPGFDYQGIGPHLAWNEQRNASSVPLEAAMALFLHDCPPTAALKAASRLCVQPESGRAMVNRLSAECFGRVPRIYVECRQDRSVTLPLQQRMQQLTPGARRISLDCGHVPQLACPQALSDALLPALDEIQSKPFMSLRMPLINV